MLSGWRDTLKEAVPVVAGALSTVLGFILLRFSAVYESWLLLFVSFALMIWGIVVVFTGNWRPPVASEEP